MDKLLILLLVILFVIAIVITVFIVGVNIFILIATELTEYFMNQFL